MPNFATGREERMQLELRDLSRLTRFASSRTRWILKRCVKSNWADSDAVSGLGKGLIFRKHLGKGACLNSMPPCQNLKLQTHFRASSGWAYELQTWSEPYLAKQQATTAFVFRELLRVQRVSCFEILSLRNLDIETYEGLELLEFELYSEGYESLQLSDLSCAGGAPPGEDQLHCGRLRASEKLSLLRFV